MGNRKGKNNSLFPPNPLHGRGGGERRGYKTTIIRYDYSNCSISRFGCVFCYRSGACRCGSTLCFVSVGTYERVDTYRGIGRLCKSCGSDDGGVVRRRWCRVADGVGQDDERSHYGAGGAKQWIYLFVGHVGDGCYRSLRE